MSVFSDGGKLSIAVTCASGVERVLKKELSRIGVQDAPAVNGRIEFSGDALTVARCNLNLRTADRVYVKAGEFVATDFDALFDAVTEIPWEEYLEKDGNFTVVGKSVKSKLFALSALQSVIKKAIALRLGKAYGLKHLPENGAKREIRFSLYGDLCSLFINTSGEGLHKRGYRDLVGIAPIKETLASAILLMSDFYKDRPLYDPFCGSGTFVIEGARIALGIAPGINRKFAFNEWKNFPEKAYASAVEEAKDKIRRDVKLDFRGSDIDGKAVALAKRHAERAGVGGAVSFKRLAVSDFVPNSDCGTVVTNPPYGERVIGKKEARECAVSLGNALKDFCGWSAFVITSDDSFEKYFGKKAERRRKLFNSEKECYLYYYYGKKEI